MSQLANPIVKALIFILLSSFFGALIGAANKYASQYISIHVIVFCQYALGFLFSLPSMQDKALGLGMFKTSRLRLHILRSAAGLVAFYAFFLAIQHIPLVDGSLLRNSAPLCVPILAWIGFRLWIPRSSWLPLIIGFAGVLFILKPGGDLNVWHLVGLSSGVLLGVSMITTRMLVATEPTSRVMIYYFGFSLLVTLPVAILYWQPAPWQAWLAVLGLGVSITLAMRFYTLSFVYAKPSLISPVSYMGVVFSGLLGWMFWDEVPDLWSLIGIALVVVGAILVLLNSESQVVADDVRR